MSCWTNITGMIELDVIKVTDLEELENAFDNVLEKILNPKLKELKLEWSEGWPDFKIMKSWNWSLFLIYRWNLRSFWEKYENGEWKTDFTELKQWLYNIIKELNSLFNYDKYNNALDYIYNKIDNDKELLKELKKDIYKDNNEYEKKRDKKIKDIVLKEYNNLLPVYMKVSNLLFQWINSYKDKITFNLDDLTNELIIMENNVVIEKREIS